MAWLRMIYRIKEPGNRHEMPLGSSAIKCWTISPVFGHKGAPRFDHRASSASRHGI